MPTAVVRTPDGYKTIELGGGGGGLFGEVGGSVDFSVNAAALNGGYDDGSVILRTGTRPNAAGAYNGGGTGNKAIGGVFGFNGLPIGDLEAIEYTWENVDGPGGPFFNPPGAMSVLTPYVNFVVDFDPLGAGDLKVCVALDDSLNAAITAAIGTFSNPGGDNILTYAWDGLTQDILIVGQVPPAPGGVPANVSVGASWLENSYTWQAIIAANPDAILVDAFTGDGGLPAGAVTPAIMVASGDSGNVVRSSKKISAFSVNGNSVLGTV